MTLAPIGIQRRMMELGVVRFGDQTEPNEEGKRFPKKLDYFRLTSASRLLLEAAAEEYGGTVEAWEDAPNEGMWELHTQTDSLPIVIPPVYADENGEPTYPFRQWYEHWQRGGCQRRCDGRTEVISGQPCMCSADERLCKIVTRVRFILPDLPGIGLWRLNTGGYNAAVELPATLEFLAAQAGEGTYLRAVLRLEQRSSKKNNQTRRFAVPVIDLPDVRVRDMLPGGRGTAPALTAPPTQVGRARPEIPAGPNPPLRAQPTHEEDIPFGDPAELPLEPQPLEKREPEVQPVGGDDVLYATDDQRRNVFKARDERGLSRDQVKGILRDVTGQETTEKLPAHLVEVVIARILAEPTS